MDNFELDDIYLMSDGCNEDQPHHELIFVFRETNSGSMYEYGLELDCGMSLDMFRDLMAMFATAVRKNKPQLET